MNQNQHVRQHLKKHGSINPLQALSLYGVFRLASRIYDLKKEGMVIMAILCYSKGRKKYCKYVTR